MDLNQYLPVLLFILVGVAVGIVPQVLGYLLGPNRPNEAKNSAYECGFEAFEDARMKFDVRYYLVAILFILFDLEIAFLFPWAAALKEVVTGEISVTMLKDFGVRYAIVGHSERRQYHGETDDLVAKKAQAALAAGITPIVCVGETLAQREAGQTEAVVKRQLAAVIHANGHCISEIVLAYEPVWAIGTGKTASPEQAQAVHALLRLQLRAASAQADRIQIVYGGSMNAANAGALLSQPDIDGGLIGGASLKAADFLSIIAEATALAK